MQHTATPYGTMHTPSHLPEVLDTYDLDMALQWSSYLMHCIDNKVNDIKRNPKLDSRTKTTTLEIQCYARDLQTLINKISSGYRTYLNSLAPAIQCHLPEESTNS